MIIAPSSLKMGYIVPGFAFDSGMTPAISPPGALANDEAVWNGTVFVPRQRSQVRLAANQTTTLTTYADITALIIPINRVGIHTFEYDLIYETSATSEGAGFQVVFSGTATGVQYTLNMFVDATNQAPISVRETFGGGPPPQAAGPSFVPAVAYINGSFNATAIGDLSVQFRAESGGANSVTVKTGSWGRVDAQ